MSRTVLLRWIQSGVSGILLALCSFQLTFFWKHEEVNFAYGSVIAVMIFLLALYGGYTLRRGMPVFIIVGLMLCSQQIAQYLPDFSGQNIVSALFWHGVHEPRLRVLWGAVLCVAFAWVFAPVVTRCGEWMWRRMRMAEPRRWKYAIIFVLLLTVYSSVLAIARHQSFLSTAFDFAIFDQALFQFSRFTPPVSTVRQFTNLFLDHQHFSIILLAPLYWVFRGMHGIVLAGLSPILLIAVPSIMLALAVKELTQKNASWVLVFSALFLFVHPFTQAAVRFYFHEKFLVPTLISITLYALARYARRRDYLSLMMATLITVLWMLSKEDQWIFVLSAGAQLIVHVYLWSSDRSLRRSMSVWVAGMSMLSIAYAVILRVFADRLNPMYSGMYTNAKRAFIEVLPTGNISAFFDTLQIGTDAHLYVYQHLFGIDSIGFFGAPINIMGEYAERIFNSSPSIHSPFYHYGVAVPFYDVIGVIVLVFLLQRYRQALARYVLSFAVLVVCFGLLMVSGWNGLYYLHTIPQAVVRDALSTHERRVAFWDGVSSIPADASVVAAEGYAPHLSARQQSIRWPDEVNWPAGTPGKIDMYTYEYWVLPPRAFLKHDTTDYATQIEFLTTQGYRIVERNEFVVILKKE